MNGIVVGWARRFGLGACSVAFAAVAEPVAGQGRDIQPHEWQALSPICQAVFKGEGTRKERLAPFAYELEGSCGIHHTCNGELAFLRFSRMPASPPGAANDRARQRHRTQRNGLLQKAVNEYGYEARCATPHYPLLPRILTERGKALSLQGNHAAAMKDFSRALEINPGYNPARQGMAQAQARMIAPKPQR